MADLWSCFEGQSYGALSNIDKITMFADYRVPQALHYFGVLQYDEQLSELLRSDVMIPSGSPLECEIRGCSVLAVEEIRRALSSCAPNVQVSAIEIDYYLWVSLSD